VNNINFHYSYVFQYRAITNISLSMVFACSFKFWLFALGSIERDINREVQICLAPSVMTELALNDVTSFQQRDLFRVRCAVSVENQ